MSARQYPDRPIVGVGAVIVRNGKVVLVRRGKRPLKGEWSIPGGMIELGETLRQAAEREALEETSLHVEALDVLEVADSITPVSKKSRKPASPAIRYHYVLIDFLCRVKSGTLRAGADALEARWVGLVELPRFAVTEELRKIICKAFRMHLKAKS